MTPKRQNATAGSDRGSEALCSIPVFRPVAIQLLSLLTQEDTDLLRVSTLLKSDPGFSAEILTLANSALYSLNSRVNTIERALLLLGVERTRALVTRAALQGMVRGIAESAAVENCWIHSRATAAIAQWLAPYYFLHPDWAYTLAILHDVGRLGLLAAHGARYAELLARVSGTNQSLLDAESVAFSVDHCSAGAWLAKTWRLPEEFQETAFRHHAPVQGAPRDPYDLVALACALAQSLGYRAAPMLDTGSAEDLFEQMPGPLSFHGKSTAADLAYHVQREVSA
jgi:HD-like signal output (HDOD) protein